MILLLIGLRFLFADIPFQDELAFLSHDLKNATHGKHIVIAIGALYCAVNDTILSPLSDYLLTPIESELTSINNLDVIRFSDLSEADKVHDFIERNIGKVTEIPTRQGTFITPDWYLWGKVWPPDKDSRYYLLDIYVIDLSTLARIVSRRIKVPIEEKPSDRPICPPEGKEDLALLTENISRGDLKIQLRVPKQILKIYRDSISFEVKVNRDCYLLIIDYSHANNKIYQIFPNSLYDNEKIHAGETVRIPTIDTLVFVALPPPGDEDIKVFASERPIYLPIEKLVDLGGYYEYKGKVEELLRDIRNQCPPPCLYAETYTRIKIEK